MSKESWMVSAEDLGFFVRVGVPEVAELMRSHGVRRLKTDRFEIELTDEAPSPELIDVAQDEQAMKAGEPERDVFGLTAEQQKEWFGHTE